ncbi:MAG: HEAT repeat domain-containing protein [Synechococcaceae cyanobacterium]
MPTPFWAAFASLLALVLWLITRRQPRALLRSTDTSAVAALNRAQLVGRLATGAERLTAASQPPSAAIPPPEQVAPEPLAKLQAEPQPGLQSAEQRRTALRQLRHWAEADPEQRLRAVRAARRSGHPAMLPLLRRGLRDGDLRVVAEAAAALERFRGRPSLVQPGGAAMPRRVSRTR